MAAGNNEKLFRKLVSDKFGENLFSGKQRYSITLDDEEKVSVSVDESICLPDGSEILIEIDSGNAAKIIVGQYFLLNGLYKKDRDKAFFVVIHCHTDKGRDYNPQRTMNNLKAAQALSGSECWISYNALHLNDVRSLVEQSEDFASWCAAISPNKAALSPSAGTR